jgi:hypothetical protein
MYPRASARDFKKQLPIYHCGKSRAEARGYTYIHFLFHSKSKKFDYSISNLMIKTEYFRNLPHLQYVGAAFFCDIPIEGVIAGSYSTTVSSLAGSGNTSP